MTSGPPNKSGSHKRKTKRNRIKGNASINSETSLRVITVGRGKIEVVNVKGKTKRSFKIQLEGRKAGKKEQGQHRATRRIERERF